MNRAERRRRTAVIQQRRLRQRRIMEDESPPFSFLARFEALQGPRGSSRREERIRGRLRKHNPFDCGKARCYCCHSAKLEGRPTRQDFRAPPVPSLR